jgi:glucose/arabinose dehydrogenase
MRLLRTVCVSVMIAGAGSACSGEASPGGAAIAASARSIGNAFVATPVAQFSEPWAMTFLPDGRLLVTEKKGALKLLSVETGKAGDISGVPRVAYGGQGGFGDVILHPQFAGNGVVYVSFSEPGDGGVSGAAVARAKLVLESQGNGDGNGGRLEDLSVIWRQVPKVSSGGHWGHRMAFGPDGKLWVTSSERQQFTPAQDMASNLGKIVRLNDDGSVPADNPFFARGGVTSQIWSLGHRNMLGLAFARGGKLYSHEMGPRGGDELNVIEKGANYGYPIVSNGDHYNGRDIPDHPTRPEFRAPLVSWTPVISPAGFIIYSGKMFPDWAGDGFIGGLSSESLVRVEFGDGTAREAQRFDMGQRIREVEEGPDGAIWLLEDGRGGGGRLLKLTKQ